MTAVSSAPNNRSDDALYIIFVILFFGAIWALFAARNDVVAPGAYPTLEMHGILMFFAFLLGMIT